MGCRTGVEDHLFIVAVVPLTCLDTKQAAEVLLEEHRSSQVENLISTGLGNNWEKICKDIN